GESISRYGLEGTACANDGSSKCADRSWRGLERSSGIHLDRRQSKHRWGNQIRRQKFESRFLFYSRHTFHTWVIALIGFNFLQTNGELVCAWFCFRSYGVMLLL